MINGLLVRKKVVAKTKVVNSVRRDVTARPSLKPWKPWRGHDDFHGLTYAGKSLCHISYFMHKHMFFPTITLRINDNKQLKLSYLLKTNK